ncbi:MAG: GNAT family N-acetyltransferase [Paracoccaceae bacterium]
MASNAVPLPSKFSDLIAQEIELSDVPPTTLAQWSDLASGMAPGRGALFGSPQMATAFARTFQDEASVSLLELRDKRGELRGVLSLMRNRVKRGPRLSTRYTYLQSEAALLSQPDKAPLSLRQLSTPLSMASTTLRSVPVCAERDRNRVLPALFAALPRLKGWQLGTLSLTQPDAEKGVAAIPGAWRVPLDRVLRYKSQVSDGETWLAGQSQKFRQNLRRGRRFTAERGLHLTCLSGRAVFDVLPMIADVQARSWKTSASEKGAEQSLIVPWAGPQQMMLDTLARQVGIDTHVFVIASEANGQPDQIAGALLSMVFGPELYLIVIFADAAMTRESLGHQLIMAGFDKAAELGLSGVDLNSNAQWTSRYADTEIPYENVHFTRPGVTGAPLRFMAQAVTRLRPVA